MARGDFDPQRVLAALSRAGVHFVLIGGMAAILHGDVGVTRDLDVVPEYEPDNLERLAKALRALGARIRAQGEPAGLAFDCSAAFLREKDRQALPRLRQLLARIGNTSGAEDR